MEDYESRFPSTGDEPVVCVPLKGLFHYEGKKDASLEEVEFQDILKTLRPALEARNFRFAKATDYADDVDLLLVVHYGNTVPEVEDVFISSEEGDEDSFEQVDPRSRFRISRILGTTEMYELPTFFSRRDELFSITDEDRYFIVVIAYDFQKLRTGIKEMLWRTRLSVPDRRIDFDEALPVFARAGAQSFGLPEMEAVENWQEIVEGDVTVGEIEVIGVVEEPDTTADGAPVNQP